MNYMEHCRALCSGRQSLRRHRNDSTYYESHHIIPKSLGGSDDTFNLVLLTAKHKQAIRRARLAAPPRSEESREKMRKSALNRGDNFTGNHLRAKCPHCLEEGQKNAMLRWHFNNCKVRKEVANA